VKIHPLVLASLLTVAPTAIRGGDASPLLNAQQDLIRSRDTDAFEAKRLALMATVDSSLKAIGDRDHYAAFIGKLVVAGFAAEEGNGIDSNSRSSFATLTQNVAARLHVFTSDNASMLLLETAQREVNGEFIRVFHPPYLVSMRPFSVYHFGQSAKEAKDTQALSYGVTLCKSNVAQEPAVFVLRAGPSGSGKYASFYKISSSSSAEWKSALLYEAAGLISWNYQAAAGELIVVDGGYLNAPEIKTNRFILQ
jgi:hypothetical protein